MKTTYKKIAAILVGLFNVMFGTYLFLQLLTLVGGMLEAGYREGAGILQFIKVYTGIPLLLLVGIAWLAFIIFIFNFYHKSFEEGTLIKRISIITSLEFYLFSIIIILFQISFPMPLTTMDIILIASGVIIGSVFIYTYKKVGNSNVV